MDKVNDLMKSGEQQSLTWIYEDELPEDYPYDEMFQYSKVDIVRMFPVFSSSGNRERESKDNSLVSYLDKASDIVSTWSEWKKQGADATKFTRDALNNPHEG